MVEIISMKATSLLTYIFDEEKAKEEWERMIKLHAHRRNLRIATSLKRKSPKSGIKDPRKY
jgi:hypothetical protein